MSLQSFLTEAEIQAEYPRVQERIRDVFSLPFRIANREVTISASVGVALSKKGYDQADDILKDADRAMYRTRSSRKAPRNSRAGEKGRM